MLSCFPNNTIVSRKNTAVFTALTGQSDYLVKAGETTRLGGKHSDGLDWQGVATKIDTVNPFAPGDVICRHIYGSILV